MYTIPIPLNEAERKEVNESKKLGINYTNILVNTDEFSTSVIVDEEEKAQVFFLKNPYPNDILKEYLNMAASAKILDSAKSSKLKEITRNPEVSYDLDELQAKNILDKSRKEAIILINEFKTGESDG